MTGGRRVDPERRHPPPERAAAPRRPVRDAAGRSTRACSARTCGRWTASGRSSSTGSTSIFFFPYLHIRFLEIPPASTGAAPSSRHRRPSRGSRGRGRRGRRGRTPTSSSTRTSSAASARSDGASRRQPSRRLRRRAMRRACAGRSESSGRAGPGATLPAVPKNLVIVESPAKARTIERYLGDDYRVLASYGHVRDLPENPGKGKFGVDVDHDFAPEYVDLRRSQEAGRRDHEGRQVGRHGLPRHRPRPRGRGDRLARRRGRQRPGGEDPAGDVQRDHRGRDPRRVRPPAPDRHEPRRRPADAPDRRPPRRLHAQPAAVAQGPRGPVGRPRPVGRRPARRRARARDRRLHRPRVLDARGDPRDRRRRRRSPPRSSGSTAQPLDVGDGETAERHAAALRELTPRRHEGRDAQADAQPGAAVHDVDAPAGGEPQARLQPEADDVDRPAPVRGRRHAGRPRRAHHLHANGLDRDRRRRDGRGPRRHPRPVRRAVHDAEGPGLQDEGEGRPGGPRVDPPDELPARPGIARGLAQARGAPPLPPDLAAGDRLADGGQGDGDDDDRARGRAVRAAGERHADAVRRLLAGLHGGPRRRRRRGRGGAAPAAARRGRRDDRRRTSRRPSTSPSRRRASPRRR